MAMDESAERKAVTPAEMEVLDVDVLVGRRFPLAPEQETLLGGHLLDGDVLDGEAEDDGPDHTKGHLDVAVDDLWKNSSAFKDVTDGFTLRLFCSRRCKLLKLTVT